MKKRFFLTSLIFGLYILTLKAQTSVPAGIVSGMWTLAGSPYKILGSVQIPNDSVLIIQPGVTVDFQGPYKFAVQGQLIAIGTATDTIHFTTSLPHPIIPPSPTPSVDTSHWLGIIFDNTPTTNDSSKIIYCKVQFVQKSGSADPTNANANGGITFNNYSKAIISRCSISNCAGSVSTLSSSGAAIYCYNGASPDISYNLISNNPSYGIYCDNNCNSKIIYNTISNNSSTGIYCYINNAIISNNIISNNSGENGGGIYCHQYYLIPTIINNVITNNSAAKGGGIFFGSSYGYSETVNNNPSLYNNIIWGNTAINGGSQVYLDIEGSDPNFYYCDVQGGSAAFDVNNTTYTGKYQNNINTNPLFVAPSDSIGNKQLGGLFNWSLQSNSPCIDKGNPFDTSQVFKYPETDIAGNPRVNVCRIDMGAYEYQNGISFVTSLNISQAISCNGSAVGEITSVTTGGTQPYTYFWSNGKTTSNIRGIVAGVYTLTVSTIASGCSLNKSITLTEPAAIAVDAGTNKTIVCDGTVQLDAEPGWVTLNSGITAPLYSVYFTSADTGYAVGGLGGGVSVILKTTDGGANWKAQTNIPPNASRLFSVNFANANTGYAVGDQGIVLKTIDGGVNWSVQKLSSINVLQSVYFINDSMGYACGQGVADAGGIILKTIDGGTSWTTQVTGKSGTINSVYFMNADTGYAVGGSGIILKTIDGGANWTTQTIGNNYNSYYLSSVYFTNTDTVYVSGGLNPNSSGGGMVFKTTNGGTNWTALTSGTTSVFNSIFLTDINTVYAVGGVGDILKTSNGGTNWDTIVSRTSNNLNSVFFPDTYTGYAVGANGTILKLSGRFSSYKWTTALGLNNDAIQNPIATMIHDTKYFVTVTTPDGCTAIDSVAIVVNPLTVSGRDTSLVCGHGAVLRTNTNYNGTGKLTYSWLPVTGLDSSTIANPFVSSNSGGTYTVTASTPNGCIATDNIHVTLNPLSAIEICIVGVDSANENIIVWNNPSSTAINSFYIYRETNVTNVYQKIGTTSYGNLSVFVDVNSHPDVQSNRYKISIKDNCGLESDMSAPHQTMHLSINQGQGNTWNLIWDSYQGFTVSTYNVYRGTTPNNLQLIGSSSGSNAQYSDLSAPSGFIYYQVEVVSPNQCNPSRSYNSSRSNIATNNGVGIFENSNPLDLFSIYPNPAFDFITLNIGQIINTFEIMNIYNALGGLVFSESLRQNQQQINVGNLSNGVYTVEIKSNEWSKKQELIIQR